MWPTLALTLNNSIALIPSPTTSPLLPLVSSTKPPSGQQIWVVRYLCSFPLILGSQAILGSATTSDFTSAIIKKL
jgi:hypothetical protein